MTGLKKRHFLALFRTTLVLIADINTGTTKIFRSQWWINEFLNHERGRILRSIVRFEAPSHIHYVFVVRIVKNRE